MNWLARLFGTFGASPRLSEEQQAALKAYRALGDGDAGASLEAQRFVVVDVETTGLNLWSDRLIAIGAVTLAGGVLRLGQGFEAVLRQDEASSVENILIHGIDGTAQITGQTPVEGLLAFLSFISNAPLVAYHAAFDRTMIDRATRQYLGTTIGNPWIDLAYVAPALYPHMAPGCRALDDWTAAFNIENPQRHNAVADAYATAQLLLVMLARAQGSGARHSSDLLRLEKDQRWLSR